MIFLKREIKVEADRFLEQSVKTLEYLPYQELEKWPDYPNEPDYDLNVPEVLSKYEFYLMKDSMEDGSLRIAVQRHRSIFLGFGEITAEGFFIWPNGLRKRMEEKDKWEIT